MALAQIREDEATGSVAEAYARLRRTLGVPLVNFIWRHLATIDGALDFALPRVAQASPLIDATIPRVRQEADALVVEHRLGAALGSQVTLSPAVRDVIAVYDRGNCWNFLAMSVLAAARAGHERSSGAPPGEAGGGETAPAVPPMPRYEDLAPQLRAIVDRLGSVGPAARHVGHPSLWIHLGLWPDELIALEAPCAQLLASPAFARAYASFRGRGPALLGLQAPEPGSEALPGEQPIDCSIRLFRTLIAEMILVGRVLLHASPMRGMSN